MATEKKNEQPAGATNLPATEKAMVDVGYGDEAGLDETKPGGEYIVDGQKVNAHGEPVGKKKADTEE